MTPTLPASDRTSSWITLEMCWLPSAISGQASLRVTHSTGYVDTIVTWKPIVVSATDYYPFSMQMPGRYSNDTSTYCFTTTRTGYVPAFINRYYDLDPPPYFSISATGGGSLGSSIAGDLRLTTYGGAFDGLTMTLDSLWPGASQTIYLSIVASTGTYWGYITSGWTTVASVLIGSPGMFPVTLGVTFTPTTTIAVLHLMDMSTGSSSYTVDLAGISVPRWDSSTMVNIVSNVCSEGTYHYGYNGQMKDNEWAGVGNHYDYGLRAYDSRIGRPISVDPLFKKYPYLSSYQFFSNNPIRFTDLDGAEAYDPLARWFLSSAAAEITQHPTSTASKKYGASLGVGSAVGNAVMGISNTIVHPIETAKGLSTMLTKSPTEIAVDYGLSLYNQYGDLPSDAQDAAIKGQIATDLIMVLLPFRGLAKGSSTVGAVWSLNPLERGLQIEAELGGNLPKNFPVIDKFANGVATSIKSIDLAAPTYQNASNLNSTLNKYINAVANFDGGSLSGVDITGSQIQGRALKIAIPQGVGTSTQMGILEQAVKTGASKGVDVTISQIK